MTLSCKPAARWSRTRRAIECQGRVDTKPATANESRTTSTPSSPGALCGHTPRRVASGDVDALTDMTGLATELDEAIAQAVIGLRDGGYSWAKRGPARCHPAGSTTALGPLVETNALQARVPEVSPNCHEQPTVTASSDV